MDTQAEMIIRQPGKNARRIAALEEKLKEAQQSEEATSRMYAELVFAAWNLCKVAPPSPEALALLFTCQPHAGSVDMNHCQCDVCERLRFFVAALSDTPQT